MSHGCYFGMLELQPINLFVTAPDTRFAVSQPLYLLVAALGSRLAVTSNLAVAALGRGSN